MNRSRTRLLTLALTLAVTIAACTAGAGIAAAQESTTSQGYSISIETPEQLTAADGQTIGVEVDNTNGDSDLFNPIVEIPLPASYDVSQGALENAYVEYDDGTAAAINDASVQASSFRDGDAVFLFGGNIPQGDSYTYYVNVSVDSPGETTLEAETRLLYNENEPNVTARTEQPVRASGFGTLTALVDGSDASSTGISINGSPVGDDSTSVDRVEGTYTIAATAPESAPVELPSFTQTIGVNDNATVSYHVPTTLADPTTIAATRSGTVVDGSISEVTTQAATAEKVARTEVNFLLRTDGGTTVVAVPNPDIGPVSDRSTTTSAGSVSTKATEDANVTNARVETAADTTVSVAYDGYRLGDANKNGAVDTSDAITVADTVPANESGDRYYDINGDGDVTAVDAMLIAQYDSGNRPADYSQKNI